MGIIYTYDVLKYKGKQRYLLLEKLIFAIYSLGNKGFPVLQRIFNYKEKITLISFVFLGHHRCISYTYIVQFTKQFDPWLTMYVQKTEKLNCSSFLGNMQLRSTMRKNERGGVGLSSMWVDTTVYHCVSKSKWCSFDRKLSLQLQLCGIWGPCWWIAFFGGDLPLASWSFKQLKGGVWYHEKRPSYIPLT